jgi:Na+/alanine symporter
MIAVLVHTMNVSTNTPSICTKPQVGHWGSDFLAVLLFLFCYSAVLGNYAYAEGNVKLMVAMIPINKSAIDQTSGTLPIAPKYTITNTKMRKFVKRLPRAIKTRH